MEKEVKFLCHFTSIENLNTIIKNGLLSKRIMLNNSMSFKSTDKDRFDSQIDLISLSCNTPNVEMLNLKYLKNDINPVVILIDKDVIFSNKFRCYFCKKNAATSVIIKSLKCNRNSLSTDNAFHEFISSDDTQKEILVENKIPKEYIKEIVVKNVDAYDIVNYILVKNGVNIPISINKNFFMNREK